MLKKYYAHGQDAEAGNIYYKGNEKDFGSLGH